MGDRIGDDGSLMDPATVRALKWAALNWATHCSFTLYSSSCPRQQNFELPDNSRVDSVEPEVEGIGRLSCADSERPGVRETEHPVRNSDARLEFGVSEYPDSAHRHFRRSLRKKGSAHPGRGSRGLREVRRTPRKRKGKRPEREARGLPRRERTHPEKELRHVRRREEFRPESAAMARREAGAKIPEKRICPEILQHE